MPRTATITLNFSAAIDEATANAGVITLETFTGPQPISVAISGTQLIITPATQLLPRTIYTVKVGAGLRSRSAEPLKALATTRFTTAGTWGSPTFGGIDEQMRVSTPQIALGGDNSAVAVWSQYDGSRWKVMSNRYTQASGWGVAEPVEALEGNADSPQVVADAVGNAIVIWIQHNGLLSNVASNVYIAGVGWGVADLIADWGTAEAPQLAISASGSAFAVWSELQDEHTRLWARHYVFGAGWGAADVINDTARYCADEYLALPSAECLAQVAMDPAGGAVVVWRAWGGPFQIRTNRFTPSQGWGSDELLSSDSATDPRVAADAAGNYVATWREVDLTQVKVWSAHYISARGWSEAQQLTDSNNLCDRDPLHGFGNSCKPLLAMNARGDAVAVWGDANTWGRRYTADAGWNVAEAIVQASEADDVKVDPAGNVIVLWTEDSPNDGFRLRSRRYTAGGDWGMSEPIDTPRVDNKYFPRMSIDALGNAMVIHRQGWSIRFE